MLEMVKAKSADLEDVMGWSSTHVQVGCKQTCVFWIRMVITDP